MEKQLDNQRVLFRQHLLKVANLLKAALGLGLLLIAVNAGNQNILIMGTVKSRNIAFGRRLLMDSPEEVMGRFVKSRLFEACDGKTLGIDAREDMLHRPVFAA
ncbi:hypothetical protein D3C71_1728170 [compost metagenome]